MPNAIASEGRNGAAPANRETFAQLVEPYRRQIKAHCYRMSGSLFEAEDLVQESFLRAWRAFDRYEGRGTIKAWLFQIATRACLDAIAQRKRARRILPQNEFAPATEAPKGEPPADIVWLEPYPDSALDDIADAAPDPEARYAGRESVRLAFVAAIQHLPPRQRAVLLLVDVLGWTSAEAASLVGGSIASVNSALQRARATLEKSHAVVQQDPSRVAAKDERFLLERYVRAWEEKDLDRFIALLKEEATFAMPPWRQWYGGRESIRRFFGVVWQRYGRFRLLATRANGAPAFALYAQATNGGAWQAHSLQVLAIEGGAIANLTAFLKPLSPSLFAAFGFPPVLGE